MPRLYVSTIVDAPLDRVWPLLRNFGGLAAIYSALDEITLNDLAGDQVGCTRTVKLKSGAVVHERLIALSDEEHSGSYSVAADGPFENLVSSFRLRSVTDRNATFLEWITTFDSLDAKSASWLLHFLEHEVYADCFRGIAALVEKR